MEGAASCSMFKRVNICPPCVDRLPLGVRGVDPHRLPRTGAGRSFSRSGRSLDRSELREFRDRAAAQLGMGGKTQLLWSRAPLCISGRGLVTDESTYKRSCKYRQVCMERVHPRRRLLKVRNRRARPPKHPVVCNTYSSYGLRPNRRRATWLSIVAGFPVPVKTNFGIGTKIAGSIRQAPSRAGETSLPRASYAQSAPAWTVDSAPQPPRLASANFRSGWKAEA